MRGYLQGPVALPQCGSQSHSGPFGKVNNLQRIEPRFLDHPFLIWVTILTELSGSQDTKRISEGFANSTSLKNQRNLHWKRNTTGNAFSFRWLIVHLQSELSYVYLLLPASAVIQPPLPEMMDELINAVPSKNTYQLIQSLKQQTALNYVADVSRWSLTEPAISRPGVHHQVQEPLERRHSEKTGPS